LLPRPIPVRATRRQPLPPSRLDHHQAAHAVCGDAYEYNGRKEHLNEIRAGLVDDAEEQERDDQRHDDEEQAKALH
jgi:hypothetical protein